ncbi:D-alanine--D-serine ligase VanG [Sinanaerobacter chloroacetimidivorans]|uniref:D-alanine--D-alanine ligase n=1 Tax=Sinanaerobacter chloroacetimidivorans TaxID=2818044 RepID=A0A8J7W2K9_9FIRM|nr:D-alanine--D-serine ligase VanG [Sinanaerobacter chloroacetimidivorans]MBR0598243.1 D-alanine--D-serine ligase VanG [Sinanaerobacter chloroacetimidivorans]
MKKKIAILFGGCSTEYQVSLQSASAVVNHINREKYDPILLGITREGSWLRFQGPAEKISKDTWHNPKYCTPAVISPSKEVHGILQFSDTKVEQIYIDAAFPVLHGKNGEDGTLQGLLELSGIPFVGCGTLSSALCMDKDLAHVIAEASGIKTPPFFTARRHESPEKAMLLADSLGYPVFVKPARSGSSFGITKVEGRSRLEEALCLAFRHDEKVVVEKAINGFEVGCAVLGNQELTVGELDEIELQKGFFDFTEKYTLETSKIHLPARISKEKTAEIKETAKFLYHLFECRGFARVDVFLTPSGEVIFNEINTIPGFTAHSRYPSMLHMVGMDFQETIEQLIDMAVKNETVTAN